MMKEQKRRESASGYHFYNLYQNCPRKWYIRYLMRLEGEFKAPPLMLGSAVHEGKATFYQSGSIDKGIKAFLRDLKANQGSYEDIDDYDLAKRRGVDMLKKWYVAHGADDLSRYKVVAVEEELIAKMPNGFILTSRLDAVLQRNRSSEMFIMETKTTGYSAIMADRFAQASDQLTTELYAAWRARPKWPIVGVIPDIMYENRHKVECIRGDIVARSQSELREYEQGTMGVLSEIAQKASAWRSRRYPPESLFPRNTSWCLSYNHKCEYYDICRTVLSEKGEPPFGFTRIPIDKEAGVALLKKVKI